MPSILIVEDQAEMRGHLRDFVQLACPAAIVVEADGAVAAIAACRAHLPDIVLMDIELPYLDGISLTAWIRSRQPAVRVIVVSNHAAGIYVERAMLAGAFGYVTKDNVATQLPPLLQRALALKESGS